MIGSFIYTTKLLIVFFGFGFATLIAYYFISDSKNIMKIIKRKMEFFKRMDKLEINKKALLSPTSAFYEISFGGEKKKMKVFSSNHGIKIVE